jgi:hypothetical protein
MTGSAGASDVRSLIDQHMPVFDVSEHHEIRVRAPVVEAYRAVRDLDLARSKMARGLLAIRGMLAVLQPGPAGKLYRSLGRRRTLTLEDVQELGFVVLAERTEREYLIGVAGRFWIPGGGIRRIDPIEFGSFDQPGHAEGVMSFAVRPEGTGSVVSTETRVWCVDDRARRSFRPYWRLIRPFSGLIRRQALAIIKDDAERSVSEPGARTVPTEG